MQTARIKAGDKVAPPPLDASQRGSYTFAALASSASFPLSLNLEGVISYLAKWGVESSLIVAKFRYHEPVDPTDEAQTALFLHDFFNSETFMTSVASQVIAAPKRQWTRVAGLDASAPITYRHVPATTTSLSLFDKLLAGPAITGTCDLSLNVVEEKVKFTMQSQPAGALSVSRHWVVDPPSSSSTSASSSSSASSSTAASLHGKRDTAVIVTKDAQNARDYGRITQSYESTIGDVTINDMLQAVGFSLPPFVPSSIPRFILVSSISRGCTLLTSHPIPRSPFQLLFLLSRLS